jgi:hypothetical protein
MVTMNERSPWTKWWRLQKWPTYILLLLHCLRWVTASGSKQLKPPKITSLVFLHSFHFRFWFLVTFGEKVKEIRKYHVIFVYILQGKMGKTEKKQKESHATKVTKLPKTKRRKYGMNETQLSIPFDLVSQ